MKPRASMPATLSIFMPAQGCTSLVHRAAERARIAEQRGDVAEHDPRLGIVRNGADRRAQIEFERRVRSWSVLWH